MVHEMRSGEQKQGLLDFCKFVKEKCDGKALRIIEIGSYCGAGSSILATSFSNSILMCVDPWEKYIEECSLGKYDLESQALELAEAEKVFDNICQFIPNIIKYKMPSQDYCKSLTNECIDLVYIDGNHQYTSVKEDLNSWYLKVRLGGYVCGHDWSWPSVQQACREFFGREPDATFVDSSWIYFR